VQYLVLFGVVLGVNLMPAFGPPTWLVLVLFRLHEHLHVLPLVLIGAVAATGGRVTLALATRGAATWLPQRRVERLRDAGQALAERKGGAAVGLGLFLLSPLPSAQLFEVAGLMKLSLLRIAAAFFVGRLVSYSIYTEVASAADNTLGDAFTSSLTSLPSVAVQVALVVGVYLLSGVDWAARLKRS
jgi:uncharacterized membrane protein YdjX (TVP38/TMEM64 family)